MQGCTESSLDQGYQFKDNSLINVSHAKRQLTWRHAGHLGEKQSTKNGDSIGFNKVAATAGLGSRK